MKWSFLILALLFITCKPEKIQEITAGTNKLPFISSPQPVQEQDVKTLQVGSKAPDFSLPGTDGIYYSLSSFSDKKILVIVFTCNHCPTAQAYEDRIISIANEYSERDVQLIAISPNSPLGLLYEELGYSDLGDDYEEMIVRAERKNFPFPYLYDGDTQEASLKYGPVATPHTFVFDDKRILRYAKRSTAFHKHQLAKQSSRSL